MTLFDPLKPGVRRRFAAHIAAEEGVDHTRMLLGVVYLQAPLGVTLYLPSDDRHQGVYDPRDIRHDAMLGRRFTREARLILDYQQEGR